MAENVMRTRKQKKAAASPVQRESGERSANAPRVKPVRITVDLEPATHKALKIFAINAETDQSSVVRALLDQLETDNNLASEIRNAVNQ